MTPLKVTFDFTTPVVVDSEYPIHLDGLLAWCVVNEAETIGLSNAWDAGNDLSHLLERTEAIDEAWVWQASRLVFTAQTERQFMNMVRMCEPERYMSGYDAGLISGRKRNSINSGSGHERAYQFLIAYQWFERAEAWCVGDSALIHEALQRLSAVGKLTRNGFGQIKSVKITEDPTALDKWRWRTLPCHIEGAINIDYATTQQTLRAPYWKKTNRIVVKEPLL